MVRLAAARGPPLVHVRGADANAADATQPLRTQKRAMNFISSLLGRRRDDGASTEPLTTAELLGLRDAALRVGRRWLACCEDDGAVRTLAGPCGRDALEAACAAASHRGTTDDDAIALAFDDVISKPFGFGDALSAVERWVLPRLHRKRRGDSPGRLPRVEVEGEPARAPAPAKRRR